MKNYQVIVKQPDTSAPKQNRIKRFCAICATNISHKRKHARYCCASCRTKAFRMNRAVLFQEFEMMKPFEGGDVILSNKQKNQIRDAIGRLSNLHKPPNMTNEKWREIRAGPPKINLRDARAIDSYCHFRFSDIVMRP
jgi:hypothetical protein